MQIVYISNRPEVFAETLEHVALFMPFVDKATVCIPDALEHRFRPLSNTRLSTTLTLEIVLENSILMDAESDTIHTLDHQRRNYLLRRRLVESDQVKKQFIMSDDDARPLKPISLDTFIHSGRYRRYYFYDLAAWRNNQTEFDVGQLSTYAVLDHENMEHLSYASHMPQIIDRDLFNDAVSFFESHARRHPLCEWSTYFNYAAHQQPERFHPPEAFVTLCWPEHPLAWKHFVEPAAYVFENYTPRLYARNGVFNASNTTGNDLTTLSQNAIERVILWKQFSIAKHHPEQNSSLLKYLNPRTWANKWLK